MLFIVLIGFGYNRLHIFTQPRKKNVCFVVLTMDTNMTDQKNYSTQKVAQLSGYHLTSVYNRLARTGEFHGITPTKHLNGRLVWPREAIDALLEQQAKEGAQQ